MQKRFVPDELSALFQESDRIETPDPDGGEPDIEYRATGSLFSNGLT